MQLTFLGSGGGQNAALAREKSHISEILHFWIPGPPPLRGWGCPESAERGSKVAGSRWGSAFGRILERCGSGVLRKVLEDRRGFHGAIAGWFGTGFRSDSQLLRASFRMVPGLLFGIPPC